MTRLGCNAGPSGRGAQRSQVQQPLAESHKRVYRVSGDANGALVPWGMKIARRYMGYW